MNPDERMRKEFFKRTQQVMAETKDDLQEIPKVGLEVELVVTDSHGNPTKPGSLTELEFVDEELGANQIEMRTDPIQLTCLADLERELKEKERRIVEAKGNLELIRIGAIPNLKIADIEVAPKEKYLIVPTFHDDNRRRLGTNVGGTNFNRAKCISLFSSTQFNIQADGLEDAVDKMNRSFMISPFLVAVSGNARVVEGRDTGINDIRMLAWEASHDTRTAKDIEQGRETRIGTPQRYFSSIEDYFNRCGSHPFILDIPEAAFEVGIGLNWLDTRIKFIDGKPVVEYRAMSTQPTAKEDVAMAAFYIGRLTFSQKVNEPLEDMQTVHVKRDLAMRWGLEWSFGCGKADANWIVNEELNKAEFGLEMLGYDRKEITEYTDLIRERLTNRQTPADKFAERARNNIERALLEHKL